MNSVSLICSSLRNGVVVAPADAGVLERKFAKAFPSALATPPSAAGRKIEEKDEGLPLSRALLVERKGEEDVSPLASFFRRAVGRNAGCWPNREDRGDFPVAAGFSGVCTAVFPNEEKAEGALPVPAVAVPVPVLPKGEGSGVLNTLFAGLEKREEPVEGDVFAVAASAVLAKGEDVADFLSKGEEGVVNADCAGLEKGLPSVPGCAACCESGDVPAGLSVGVVKREEKPVPPPVLLPKRDDGALAEGAEASVSLDFVVPAGSFCLGGKSGLLEKGLILPTPARPEWRQRLRPRHAEFPDLHDPSFPAGR